MKELSYPVGPSRARAYSSGSGSVLASGLILVCSARKGIRPQFSQECTRYIYPSALAQLTRSYKRPRSNVPEMCYHRNFIHRGTDDKYWSRPSKYTSRTPQVRGRLISAAWNEKHSRNKATCQCERICPRHPHRQQTKTLC